MAKSLVIFSKLLRSVSSLPKYHAVTQVCYSSHLVPEVKSQVKPLVRTAREIFELLNKNDNPSSVIAIIEANRNEIDGRHVVTALNFMKKYYQANQVPSEDIHNSVPFVKICKTLNRHLTKLEMPEIITALKVLNILKISNTSVIVQSLLKLIIHSVNDLYLDQIYFLSYLLKHMDSTPLHDALRTALPEVFMAQLERQLDRGNIKELKNALWYATKYIDNKETIDYIMNAINRNEKPLDVDTAVGIIFSLMKIKDLPKCYWSILYRMQDTVFENATLLGLEEVMKLVLKMCKKTMYEFDCYYNPYLLDKLVNNVVSKDYGFDKGMVILNSLNKLKHIHIPLLEYLSDKCYKNPYVLEYHPLNTATLVLGLSVANYKPPFWDEIKKLISIYYKNIPDDVTISYFALRLASLDCFDSSVIEKVFSTDTNIEYLSFHYHQTLQQLYQAVKTLYPSYSGPWPSEKLIQSFKTLTKFQDQEDYPLLPALEKILGGSSYVKTNVKTDLGHDIDHLVILQNGCPIAIESTKSTEDSKHILYMEDLIIPPESKRVAILPLPSEEYGRNIQILRAPRLLNMKSLEAMSFQVVYLSIDTWLAMPDWEKLPYLERLIGLEKEKGNLDECKNR